jgi:hypothetical protein
MKLPKLKEPMTQKEYNLILVITNKLIKYEYFISYLKEFIVEDLAYIFMKHVIINHGIPKEIINNKDKLFTLKF